jgi:hypothetical protein
MRRLIAAVTAGGAAAALTILATSAAYAGTVGGTVGSAGQTGISVTNARFRFVTGSVFGRDGGNFSATQIGIGGSVSLRDDTGDVVLLGVSTGTSSHHQPWSPGINVYHDRVLVASQNDASVHGQTCTNGNCTPGDSALWPDQESFKLHLFYDRTHGNVEFEAVASASGDSYSGFYHLGTGKTFSQARVTSDFGNTPFDSLGYVAAPSAQKLYLTWRDCHVTSYSGRHGSLSGGFWVRHHIVLVDAAGNAHAGSLFDNGTAFHTYISP